MPKSTVSAKVAELEARLGVTLLKRTTRTVATTAAGAVYLATAERVLTELRSTERALVAEGDEPTGVLRISGTVGSSAGTTGDVLTLFLERHPKVTIDLVVTERRVDLLTEDIDVAMRFGKLPDDANLVARRVGVLHRLLYASPAYLARHPPVAHPRELASHAFVRLANSTQVELVHPSGERCRVALRGRFVTNQVVAMKHQALAGLGIACLPAPAAAPDVQRGALVPVLRSWRSEGEPFHLVYLKQRFATARVRAFIDFVTKHLPPDAMSGVAAG
jgi:DNA-binding transcriptional LysR family regulator